MGKLIAIITSVVFSLVFISQVYADVPVLSARIEQPKSPTNISELDITVVTLDRQGGRDITVECFKVGTATPFSTIAVAPGGNSLHCKTNSSLMPSNGTYLFYATATAGSDTATTTTVSVDYNTSGPGTPSNYSKEKPTSCTYKIKFRTANDAGKTNKVRVYRSQNTSFELNAGTLVGTVNIGSNTDGEYTDTIVDCDKTHYYAIRAFDNAENGSGVVGDSETRTTTTTAANPPAGGAGATSGAASGAIAAGTAGNVLGQETGTDATQTGDVQGESNETTPSAQEVYTEEQKGSNKLAWGIGLGVLALLVFAWLRRKNTPTS